MIAPYAILIIGGLGGFALHALLSQHKYRKDCERAFRQGAQFQGRVYRGRVRRVKEAAFAKGLQMRLTELSQWQ